METCRACLCIDKKLFQVDEHFLSSYNLLTDLNVKLCDSLSKSFCGACMESVRFYIVFRDKCICSESTLQDKIAQSVKLDECLISIKDIKREVHCNLDENIHNGLVNINPEDNIKKKECVVITSESLEEKERNPAKLMEIVKKPIRKAKIQIQTREENQPQKKMKDCEYNCGLCDESFIILDELNSHLNSHQTDNHCGICSEAFENWPKLLAHRAMHSAKKICHLCLKRFNSMYRMEQHYLHVHFEDKLKEMSCTYCQKKFTCPEKYSLHLATHTKQCHMCPEIFPNRHLLKVHLRTHDPEKRYQCDQCEYTALYANVLATHRERRHKKFFCKTCERKFANRAKLQKHVCKDKSKLCPVCGQRIYDSLNRHLQSHQNEKNYKCTKCPASYKTRMSLNIHLDKHDNNPRYECDYCGRKFFNPTNIGKHRRIHTGEKPYACKMCSKRFSCNTHLRVHMKVHGIMLINKRNKDPSGEVPVVASATQ